MRNIINSVELYNHTYATWNYGSHYPIGTFPNLAEINFIFEPLSGVNSDSQVALTLQISDSYDFKNIHSETLIPPDASDVNKNIGRSTSISKSDIKSKLDLSKSSLYVRLMTQIVYPADGSEYIDYSNTYELTAISNINVCLDVGNGLENIECAALTPINGQWTVCDISEIVVYDLEEL